MPKALKDLIEVISLLPGIGEKTASKLAFFLLKSHSGYLAKFSQALQGIKENTDACPTCYALMDKGQSECMYCQDIYRDASVICVVEEYLDLVAIENTGAYKGLYHVLGGAISPMNGVGPADLTYNQLFERLSDVTELVIATNPNFEWEATAIYLKENIPHSDIKLSRLSRGLPNAGYIEYADEMTLMNAFNGRKDF